MTGGLRQKAEERSIDSARDAAPETLALVFDITTASEAYELQTVVVYSTALDVRSTGIIIHPRFALRRRNISLLEKWPSHPMCILSWWQRSLCECCFV